jgi:hypothetical protein
MNPPCRLPPIFQLPCMLQHRTRASILSTVHILHHEFPDPPRLHHVKGHQDNDIFYEDLPLPAPLNVEADALATRAMEELGSVKPIVPFDPLSKAMVQVAGRSVTRSIAMTIWLHMHLQPIKHYCCKRYVWDYGTWDEIDWESYSSAYHKFTCTQMFFYKFDWKKLAVGSRLHEQSPCYNHRCPACHADYETNDHVFRCNHPSCSKWRTMLISSIMAQSDSSYRDPLLMDILRTGLHAYFTNTPPDFDKQFPRDPEERFPAGSWVNSYHDLINQQQDIGWDHFLRGKLSKEWTKVQFQYAHRNGKAETSSGWVPHLIKLLANSSFDAWKIRNSSRHGNDTASKRMSHIDHIQWEVHAMYWLKSSALPQDQTILRASLDAHLQDTLHSL